ncbi:MAG: universal stress protein, partial [Saprospiraceae bacterium]
IQVLNVLPVQTEGLDVPVMIAVSTQEVIEGRRLELTRWVEQTIAQVQVNYEFEKPPVLYEVIELGTPIQNILSFADLQRSDLIVIGTKERHSWLERTLGTVSGGVVRRPPCPVLLIPENSNFKAIKRVTYATSFTAADPYYLWKTLEILKPFTPAIDAVHLCQDENEDTDLDGETLNAFGRTALETKDFRVYNVETDDIAHGLEDFAESDRADVLVMYKPRESFVHRLFYASETQRMAELCKIPLLVMV